MLDPNSFKKAKLTQNHDVEDIYRKMDNYLNQKELKFLEFIVTQPEFSEITSYKELQKLIRKHCNEFGLNTIRKNKILLYLKNRKPFFDKRLMNTLVKKPNKSTSGILSVTVLTSPYVTIDGITKEFSCHWDCHYCPKEPNQPRSYLHDEPAVLRANANQFDPKLQFIDRCLSLYLNGHPIDKIELLVLGGTWHSYPKEYRETFVRDLFYAANNFLNRNPLEPGDLQHEKKLNESSNCRIIGLTLETRPDCITPDEIKHLRRLGCTRVQLGVQHTDYKILKKINRKCYLPDIIKAIKLLKDACYKIDIHLMTQLPLATPESDHGMFNEVLTSPDLQVDQWKIYPCEITPWTKIKQWYDKGIYKPYDDDKLTELLIDVKSRVHPYIRLNRVIRDIPSQYIYGGNSCPNLREELALKMNQRGLRCRCIRCREIVKMPENYRNADPVLKKRYYTASEAKEIFISFETLDECYIYGFLRLRLPSKSKPIFNSLSKLSLVRELHVYGNLKKTGNKDSSNKIIDSQHTGLGTRLIKEAEKISWHNGYQGLAIISGVGVRNYYRSRGYFYEPDGEFMVKKFIVNKKCLLEIIRFLVVFISFCVIIYYDISS